MTKMSSTLDDTLLYFVINVDSDEEISETELSEEATNYDTEISLSLDYSKTEQKSRDSSIKVIYEVINITKSDSENSEDEVIIRKESWKRSR